MIFTVQHVRIIGMALQYAVINDRAAAESAGFDAFFLRPAIDMVDGQSDQVDVSSIRGGKDGAITAVSLDNAQLRSQRNAYEKFVRKVLAVISTDTVYRVDIQSNVDTSRYGDLAGYLEVPDGVVSSDLTITGTVAQVNHVLKKVYYFAPNNTNGDATMLIEAQDTPQFDCVKVPQPLSISRPLYTVFNDGNPKNDDEADTLHSACASVALTSGFVVGYSNRTIPIRVLHLNQPPEVHLSGVDTFDTAVDFVLSGLGFSVSDIDNEDVKGYTSFGQLQSAPISVTVWAIHGKLSLPNRDNLSLFVGRGIADSRISFRGPIAVVNSALEKLQYVCRATEGCGPHYTDRVTLTVSDDGFYGRGGPMTATESVSVTFAA